MITLGEIHKENLVMVAAYVNSVLAFENISPGFRSYLDGLRLQEGDVPFSEFLNRKCLESAVDVWGVIMRKWLSFDGFWVGDEAGIYRFITACAGRVSFTVGHSGGLGDFRFVSPRDLVAVDRESVIRKTNVFINMKSEFNADEIAFYLSSNRVGEFVDRLNAFLVNDETWCVLDQDSGVSIRASGDHRVVFSVERDVSRVEVAVSMGDLFELRGLMKREAARLKRFFETWKKIFGAYDACGFRLWSFGETIQVDGRRFGFSPASHWTPI